MGNVKQQKQKKESLKQTWSWNKTEEKCEQSNSYRLNRTTKGANASYPPQKKNKE